MSYVRLASILAHTICGVVGILASSVLIFLIMKKTPSRIATYSVLTFNFALWDLLTCACSVFVQQRNSAGPKATTVHSDIASPDYHLPRSMDHFLHGKRFAAVDEVTELERGASATHEHKLLLTTVRSPRMAKETVHKSLEGQNRKDSSGCSAKCILLKLVAGPRSEAELGTLTGRSCELAEALERRRVDFCAVQETRWSCRKSRDIGRGFKAVLYGSPRTTRGVGVIVSQRYRDSIVSVERFNDQVVKIVLASKARLYHFFSRYAPQTGRSNQAKDEFWNLLDEKTAVVPSKAVIIVAGDLNGHVGATKDGYSCHGGFGYGSRNADGERILEYAESHNLTIVNTVVRKRDSNLISYFSVISMSQIDFVLVKDRDRHIVTDAKTVPFETVAPQH
ncbi:unnamed protein product [Heligmosomoides polygyrus]|uniref:Endo/exonuclease/phosphatase domain-containing protein n=1 Tax=Heligmosomoides polygyrus TaxID=6339 RepID=A0A183G4L2_HELPZ|nr:unnamed protein product [Heligmosomoides polygyrus]